MTPTEMRRANEALDWIRRIEDPHFADWEAHAQWLESDPRNLEAFDEASALLEEAAHALGAAPRTSAPGHVNDNHEAPDIRMPRRHGWGTGFSLAIAAGIVGAIALPILMQDGSRPYMVRTAPGEPRSLTLSDGSQVALNGDSMLRIDRTDPRSVNLEKGEALFTIVHDADHPFVVHAGDATFQDIGTVFDLTRDKGQTRIAVREGAVLYDPRGSAMRLSGGQAMLITGREATVRSIDATAVGTWRSGKLVYAGTPMADVATDLSRALGQAVTVDMAAANRPFSGVIMIDADHDRMLHRVAALSGMTIRHDAVGWHMVSPAR